MRVCLDLTKPLMFSPAALCFCHHYEKNVSGLPQDKSEKHWAELPPPSSWPSPALRKLPTNPQSHDQAQSKWAEFQLTHKCMSYSNKWFKQLSFGVVVIHQLLIDIGKRVNGTNEFFLQFFLHCVSSHSSVDGAPWVYPRGPRQDSEKHWITLRECYSISKSSLVLLISLKRKSQEVVCLQHLSDTNHFLNREHSSGSNFSGRQEYLARI